MFVGASFEHNGKKYQVRTAKLHFGGDVITITTPHEEIEGLEILHYQKKMRKTVRIANNSAVWNQIYRSVREFTNNEHIYLRF